VTAALQGSAASSVVAASSEMAEESSAVSDDNAISSDSADVSDPDAKITQQTRHCLFDHPHIHSSIYFGLPQQSGIKIQSENPHM